MVREARDTLRLYAEDKEAPFVIEYYEDYGDALPKPDVLCNGNTYLVGTEEGSYYVQSLKSPNGTQYITLESNMASAAVGLLPGFCRKASSLPGKSLAQNA